MEQPELYHGSPEGSTEKEHFTPIPDVILDELLPDFSGAELKVFMYLARRTYGFQKQADSVSVSQIAEGIKRRDGTVLDRGTGLSRKAVISAVGRLRDRGLLWKVRNYDERRGDMANTYTLTLPQPCLRNEEGGECKNDTPRVKKVPPQERVRQKRENSVRLSERVEGDSTYSYESQRPEEPAATSPNTTSFSGKTSSVKKQQERSVVTGIEKTDPARERIRKLGRLPDGNEFVSYLFSHVRQSLKSDLDGIVGELGANWKSLLRKHDLTFDEAALVMERTAKDLYSPQEAVRDLVSEGALSTARFAADASRDSSEGETTPVREKGGVTEGYEWLFGDTESHSPVPEEDVERSTLADPPEESENGVEGERDEGSAVIEAMDRLLDADTRTARLARAVVEGKTSPAGPITCEDVAAALRDELDLESFDLSAEIVASIAIGNTRRRIEGEEAVAV